jgi:hypothetical protein
MKENRFIITRLLAFTLINSFAQSDSLNKKKIDSLGDHFKSLQLTSSPAYVILGVEPENIQRPNSPLILLLTLNSAIVKRQITTNFAIETSPYFGVKETKTQKPLTF